MSMIIRPKAFMDRLKADEDFRKRVAAAKRKARMNLKKWKQYVEKKKELSKSFIDYRDLINDDDNLIA